MHRDPKANHITLQSYELGVNEYITGTVAEVSGGVKTWIDRTLALLPKDARIIEIGSASGRDARYIETQGFSVECTDAAEGFVRLLQQEGLCARMFNILAEDFHSVYDLIFANCVFLHFTPQELEKVLGKAHASLSSGGILSFSLKCGEGEEWTTAKVGNPRYFRYWRPETIQPVLESVGFQVLEISGDQKFLRIIAQRGECLKEPNAKTRKAMEEAKKGKTLKAKDLEGLHKQLGI